MAVRRPLVVIDGQVRELPFVDSLPGGGGGGGIAETFETVSKNLSAFEYTLNYTGDELTSIVYANGVTKTFTYGPDGLASIILSGATPGGIDLVKTFTYNVGKLAGVSYS
jgi:hypothetical protein